MGQLLNYSCLYNNSSHTSVTRDHYFYVIVLIKGSNYFRKQQRIMFYCFYLSNQITAMAFSLINLRFRCAISWMQSYYDDVMFPFPREVLSYPYTDLYTLKIRPELVWWLTKGDPYFLLLAHILSLPPSAVTSFPEAISRLGCDGLDTGLLTQSDPILLEQHLCLTEGIMLLFSHTRVSLESINKQLQYLSGSETRVESLEDGLLQWLRAVCHNLRGRGHLEGLVPPVPSLSSLSSGCLLLLVLHFYVPQCVQILNGKFPQKPGDTLGLEEAFHNGTMVTNACMQIQQLKFCLSSQGIVRCSDTCMAPYVTSSLSSLFLSLAVTEPVCVPSLYGALIGQSPRVPPLSAVSRFHSMDSVARKPSEVKRSLLTPSVDNLLDSLRSNQSSLYPRNELSRGETRPLSRFKTPVAAVKSCSTPELSRVCPQKPDILRTTQELTQSGILGDRSPPSVLTDTTECETHSELVAGPKEAWSPLKPALLSSSSSRDSIPSLECVANQRLITNDVVSLNIFPSNTSSLQPSNPASLLLRQEAIRLRSDQSNASSPPPDNQDMRLQLGQLAFSYVTGVRKVTFEEFICSQLGINSINKLDEYVNNKHNNHIPSCDTGNQDIEPQNQNVTIPQLIKTDSLEDKQTPRQQTFYTTGDCPPSFSTEKTRNMLKMLETRNSARNTNSARQPLRMQLTPSDSLQSLHTNSIPMQQLGNEERKVTRTKVFSENHPATVSKHKSNKQIVKNAISDVCLAGGPNAAKKIEMLRCLSDSQSDHFLILFRDIIGCKFRGLYVYSQDTETARRIGGSGPREVTPQMLVKLYKYNSGAKEFQEIPTKRISSSIDAVTIHDALWTSKKRPVHL